jgi:hypothetical protein
LKEPVPLEMGKFYAEYQVSTRETVTSEKVDSPAEKFELHPCSEDKYF